MSEKDEHTWSICDLLLLEIDQKINLIIRTWIGEPSSQLSLACKLVGISFHFQ